jgi:hypothetical protein
MTFLANASSTEFSGIIMVLGNRSFFPLRTEDTMGILVLSRKKLRSRGYTHDLTRPVIALAWLV